MKRNNCIYSYETYVARTILNVDNVKYLMSKYL